MRKVLEVGAASVVSIYTRMLTSKYSNIIMCIENVY